MSRWNLAVKGIAAAMALSLPIGCISQRDHDNTVAQYETQIDGLKQAIAAQERHAAELDKENSSLKAQYGLSTRIGQELQDKNAMLAQQNKDLQDKFQHIGTENSDVMESYGNGIFVLKGDTGFDAGLATLRPRAMAALDDIAKELHSMPGAMVRIDGHTDNDPIMKTKYKWTTASNFELAAARALAVLLHFEKQGIPGSQMFMTSYGEHHPRCANDTKENKAKNRRVEIHIAAGAMPEGTPEMNTSDHGAAEHMPVDHPDHK